MVLDLILDGLLPPPDNEVRLAFSRQQTRQHRHSLEQHNHQIKRVGDGEIERATTAEICYRIRCQVTRLGHNPVEKSEAIYRVDFSIHNGGSENIEGEKDGVLSERTMPSDAKS